MASPIDRAIIIDAIISSGCTVDMIFGEFEKITRDENVFLKYYGTHGGLELFVLSLRCRTSDVIRIWRFARAEIEMAIRRHETLTCLGL